MKNLCYDLNYTSKQIIFIFIGYMLMLTSFLSFDNIILQELNYYIKISLLLLSLLSILCFFQSTGAKIDRSKINIKRKIIYFSKKSYIENFYLIKDLKKEGFLIKTQHDNYYDEMNHNETLIINNNQLKNFLENKFDLNIIENNFLTKSLF